MLKGFLCSEIIHTVFSPCILLFQVAVCRNATNPSHLPSDRGISRAFSESLDMAEHGTVKKTTENGVEVASFDPQEREKYGCFKRENL